MSMQILQDAKDFKDRIAYLKKYSDYYPSVLIREYPNDHPVYHRKVFASTLVRIERNSKWHIVHCVESILLRSNCSRDELLLKLMESVYKIQHLYSLSGMEDIDELQISEEERLK